MQRFNMLSYTLQIYFSTHAQTGGMFRLVDTEARRQRDLGTKPPV